jgi:xylulokinase
VAGAGDQAAQAVGTGIVTGGVVSVTSGTSGVVFAYSDRFVAEAEGRLHAFCHAVPGKWHLMGVMLSAGGSLRWFRDALGQKESQLASLCNLDPYELLTSEAARAPVGSDGLLFLPYLTGERTPHPDPKAKGAFVGLTLRHRKQHLVRSVLEGVSFGLRDCLELVRGLGVPIEQVRISGGGARSELWRQIQADVFGTELVQVSVTEGAAFGAALLAGVGAGVYPSVAGAVRDLVKVTETTLPQEENRSRYEALYHAYRSLYPALKPSFETMADLDEQQ